MDKRENTCCCVGVDELGRIDVENASEVSDEIEQGTVEHEKALWSMCAIKDNLNAIWRAEFEN